MNLSDLTLRPQTKRSVKTFGGSLIALLAVSAGLSFSNTVHADNAQMTDLPKSINADQNKIPGQYAFTARVNQGITKVTPFGGNNEDWCTSASHTEEKTKHWFAFKISDNDGNNDKWKGKVGVYYSNVGVYDGHIVDVKITMMDWKVQNYEWVDTNHNNKADTRMPIKNAYLALGKDDFEMFTPGYGAVKYRLDYLDHNTHKPIKMTAAWTFDDIDGDQWVGIEPTTFSSVDQIVYGDHDNNGNTWLSYKKMGGKNYIYSNARQHNTAITDKAGHNEGTLTSHDKKGGFTATYSDSSSFIIDWVFGENTGDNAIKDQDALEAEPSYWNMVGKYDPDADTEYPITDISSSIDATLFNHAFLKYGTDYIAPDKPMQPTKFVSDSDEGTNTPSEIGTDKSVDHDILKNRYEQYHYEIMHYVPKVRPEFKYTQYMITDQLDKDLDISNVHVYNTENQDVTYMFTVNVDANNKLSVVAKDDYLAGDDFYRETYKITFDGTVKAGVSLADHQDPKHSDQAVIYNDAKVTTSNGTSDSNKTTTKNEVIARSTFVAEKNIFQVVADKNSEQVFDLTEIKRRLGYIDNPQDQYQRRLNAEIERDLEKCHLKNAAKEYESEAAALKNDTISELEKDYSEVNQALIEETVAGQVKKEMFENTGVASQEKKANQAEAQQKIEANNKELDDEKARRIADFTNQVNEEIRHRKEAFEKEQQLLVEKRNNQVD